MVAYNFQARFAYPIRSGTKCQTIRRNGSRRHARRGEKLQLYTGQRSKHCKKILPVDPVCHDALPIAIKLHPTEGIMSIVIGVPDGEIILSGLTELNRFAEQDGFADRDDMAKFWLEFHGPGVFRGTLIKWVSM